MLWTQWTEQEPELARRGRVLLAEEHGYVFLATLTADGSPRLHPVAPILSDHGLFVAITRRSRKLRDVRRNPQVALHSTVLPPDDEEFSVRGVLREIEDASRRAAAYVGAVGGAQPSDAMALFEVDLLEVGWARWPDGNEIRKRWPSPGDAGRG